MKRTCRVILAISVLSTGTAFGVNRWSAQDGGWHEPASWGGSDASAIPNTGDLALVRHSLTVIADNWTDLGTLVIGKGADGAVTITTSVWPHSGRLDPTGEVNVGDGGTGTLTLDGGILTAGSTVYAGWASTGHVVVDSGTLAGGSNLMVARGYGPLGYGNGSTLTINGGNVSVVNALGMGVSGQSTGNITVSGGILNVENGLILDQGTFTVDGSSSSITLAINQFGAELDIRANATMAFDFDATGISSIGFNEKTLELHTGASIVVDGSGFTGTPGIYELMDVGAYAATGTNRFSNVSITGFDSYTSATLEYNDANGTVNLNVIPEPATLGLLAVSSGLMVLLRKLRL